MTTSSASPSNRSAYGNSFWLMNSIVTGRAPKWHLFAKEILQLLPLFLALLGAGIVIHVFAGLFGEWLGPTPDSKEVIHGMVTFLLPAFFAIGVGPILISQEKEQRTLLWLASIPISWKQIVLTKLLVALVALVLFWTIIVAIGLLFFQGILNGSMESVFSGSTTIKMYICNSFFLLFLSMVCAWTFENGWTAILTLTLLAGVVAFALSVIDHAFTDQFGFSEGLVGLVVFIAITIGLGVAASGIGWDTARRTFVKPAPKIDANATMQPATITAIADPTKQWPTKAPFSSQMWQILRQNMPLRFVLIGGVVLLLAAISLASIGRFDNKYLPPTIIASTVLMSWLGASTFASDNKHGRIRFLAERGVAPWTIWFSRMLIPALFFAGLMLFDRWWAWYQSQFPIQDVTNFQPRYALPLLFGLLIFAVTQWSSQWLRSSLLALCLAPAIAAAAVAYTVIVLFTFGNMNLLLASSITLLIASRIMMRPWMDGRTGYPFALKQLGLGIIAFCIPVVPVVWYWATTPGMSQETKAQLSALQINDVALSTDSVTLRFTDPLQNDEPTALSPVPISDRRKEVDFILKDIESQLNRFQYGVIDIQVRRFLSGEFALASATLEFLDATASTEGEGLVSANVVELESLITRYRKLVSLLDLTVQIDRRTHRLWESEFADRTEKVLVEELSKPFSKRHLETEKYSVIANRLADRQSRNLARRLAIAADWQTPTHFEFDSSKNPLNLPYRDTLHLGGFSLPDGSKNFRPIANLWSEKRIGFAAEILLRFLDSGNRHPDNPAFEAFKNYWRIDSQILPEQVWPMTDNLFTPGMHWHGDWEEDAKNLLTNLDGSTKGGTKHVN